MIDGDKITDGIYEIKDIPLKKKILYSPLAFFKVYPLPFAMKILLLIFIIVANVLWFYLYNFYKPSILIPVLTIVSFMFFPSVMTSQNKKKQYLKVSDGNIIELMNADTLQSYIFFYEDVILIKKRIVQIKDVVFIILKAGYGRSKYSGHRRFNIDACIAIPIECLEGRTNNFDIKNSIENFENELSKEASNFIPNLSFTEIQHKDNKLLFVFWICLIFAIISMVIAFINIEDKTMSIFFAIMSFIIGGVSIYGYLTPINARTFELNEKGIMISCKVEYAENEESEEYEDEHIERIRYIRWGEITNIEIKPNELEIKYEPPKKEYYVDYNVKIYEKFLQKDDYEKLKEVLLQNVNENILKKF